MPSARGVNLREVMQTASWPDRVLDAYEDGYAKGRRDWYWQGFGRGLAVAAIVELLHCMSWLWMGWY